jgi:hypothetical protein
VAARIAFPDGTMTVSGLRREAKHGRLEIETIAHKQYVTLSAIQRMRELCRDQPKERGSISENARDVLPYGSSPMGGRKSAPEMSEAKSSATAAMIAAYKLKKRSGNI